LVTELIRDSLKIHVEVNLWQDIEKFGSGDLMITNILL
jgi:hypothetical protein